MYYFRVMPLTFTLPSKQTWWEGQDRVKNRGCMARTGFLDSRVCSAHRQRQVKWWVFLVSLH